ncbi:hypothetical protein [Streptomyces sp. KL116D]|uniref:hypothetical protein n=1 Tax=Streptomyces sp. KL116D TaxID=3045152 RepID=UPI0035589FF4
MILTAFFAALPDDVRPGLAHPDRHGGRALFFVCWGAAWLPHTGVELPAMRRWSRPRAASRGSDTPHPAPGHSAPLTGERTP